MYFEPFSGPRMGFLAVRFGATYLTSNLTLGSEHAKSRADKFKDAEQSCARQIARIQR